MERAKTQTDSFSRSMTPVFKPSELKQIRATEEMRSQHDSVDSKDDEPHLDTYASGLSVEHSRSRKRKSVESPSAQETTPSKARVVADEKGDPQMQLQSDNSATADDANKSGRDSFGGQRGVTSADALEEPVNEIRSPLVTLLLLLYCIVTWTLLCYAYDTVRRDLKHKVTVL